MKWGSSIRQPEPVSSLLRSPSVWHHDSWRCWLTAPKIKSVHLTFVMTWSVLMLIMNELWDKRAYQPTESEGSAGGCSGLIISGLHRPTDRWEEIPYSDNKVAPVWVCGLRLITHNSPISDSVVFLFTWCVSWFSLLWKICVCLMWWSCYWRSSSSLYLIDILGVSCVLVA